MGLRMKNVNILGVHGKIVFLGKGAQKKKKKKTILKGELLKKGGLGHFADLRGAWQERGVC